MAVPSSVPKIRTDLAYYGVVTRVISATQFVAAGLAGLGDGALVGYGAYVLAKADGTTTAPHAEQPAVTAYVSTSGTFTHTAYTTPLAVGDQLLLLHPRIAQIGNLSGQAPVVGTTTANWQAAEANIISIGADNIRNKVHSLVLDINALVGTVTIRLYQQVNGVERRVYQQAFTVAADGPGLWIINGSLMIHEVLRVTAQSNNVADNGQAIGYDCSLETM